MRSTLSPPATAAELHGDGEEEEEEGEEESRAVKDEDNNEIDSLLESDALSKPSDAEELPGNQEASKGISNEEKGEETNAFPKPCCRRCHETDARYLALLYYGIPLFTFFLISLFAVDDDHDCSKFGSSDYFARMHDGIPRLLLLMGLYDGLRALRLAEIENVVEWGYVARLVAVCAGGPMVLGLRLRGVRVCWYGGSVV